MYVIIGNNNVVIGIASELNRQINGNVVCEGYIVSNSLIKGIVETEAIPEGVTPFAWAYADGEFYPLPVEPVEDELADALNALELLGVTPEEGETNG